MNTIDNRQTRLELVSTTGRYARTHWGPVEPVEPVEPVDGERERKGKCVYLRVSTYVCLRVWLSSSVRILLSTVSRSIDCTVPPSFIDHIIHRHIYLGVACNEYL